ncbi:MAG: beta-ketoacyl synthase N-terminal-like domain-containing protein, partial [Candidatus Pacearchaeota archaeon]
MRNRVLITGIGLVTPIGIGNKEVFDALCQGKTNMEVISFGNGEEKKFVVGKVPLTLDNFFEHYDKFKHKKDEEGKNPITKKEIRRMDRVSYLAVIASLYAISDAGFDIIKEENVGIVS